MSGQRLFSGLVEGLKVDKAKIISMSEAQRSARAGLARVGKQFKGVKFSRLGGR